MSNPIKLVVSGIVLIAALVLTLTSFKIVTIQGNQLGVKETWGNGVQAEILQPKTYFLFPGWSQTVYKYDASSQVFVMNDNSMKVEKTATGREKDAYLVQSSEGQDMHISMNLRWRIDPAKLVSLHKTVRLDMEEKVIRPVLMRVVKDEATRMRAMEAYSGQGLVTLQGTIQNALSGNDNAESKELKERGIIVENFVIEHIRLNDKYLEEIQGKQIATLKGQRAVEEQKAAEAAALVAKSLAQADLNTQVVAGDRDAQLVVIKAKAAAQQVTINADAQASQVTIGAKAAAEQVRIAAEAAMKQAQLEGEGKKLGMTAEAEGILAVGKAKAESQQKLLEAYAAKGADAWVKTQVAESASKAFSGIKGYLPSDMKVNLLTGQFQTAVDSLTGNVSPVVNTPK